MKRKQKALELLKQLNIYNPYIKGFEKKNQVCYFERYSGYWVDQEPEVYEKMKELELHYHLTVYAITHDYTDFGECYSFLIVTNYPEEWEELVFTKDNEHSAYAYVWNKDNDDCSEFGSISLRSLGGGIMRIG